jgi:phosphate transport system substrate-binding protein
MAKKSGKKGGTKSDGKTKATSERPVKKKQSENDYEAPMDDGDHIPKATFKDRIIEHKVVIAVVIVVILLCAVVAYVYLFREDKETIKISGAFALYPMMMVWKEAYEKDNPDIQIDVKQCGAGIGLTEALAGTVDIGMVSRDIKPEEVSKGAFYVSVCIDAVVPTINAGNPVMAKLQAQGVTKEQLKKVYLTGEITTWGELVNDTSNKDKINVYTRSDSCGAAETWAKFFGNYTQNDLTEAAYNGIVGDADLAGQVAKDKYGIGYNNIGYAYDMSTGKPISGLAVLPMDLNGDHILELNESFYGEKATVCAAIAAGTYPSPPARALNLVTKDKFTGEPKKFVEWILGDGQALVPDNGYVQLTPAKLEQERQVLSTGIRQ